jgi:AraC family transcriptional regulator of adaptative response/methylated-DNA-[protein]-cysteine methyltransferase
MNYAILPCPLGVLFVSATEKGIASAGFFDTKEAALAALPESDPPATENPGNEHLVKAAKLAEKYFNNSPVSLEIAMDPIGTEFQKMVWEVLCSVERGKTETYTTIAHRCGLRDTANRAIARACATNPVALFIPCHRVVREDGSLAGYRWGIERKKSLLLGEGATLPVVNSEQLSLTL